MKIIKESNDVVTVGIYGDEVPGFSTVASIVSYFKNKGIKVSDVSGDMDYGWEMNLTGNPKNLFFAVVNTIPGYNSDSVSEFIDEYRIDESLNEDLDNLESTDNTVVINQPTGAAEEESKEYQKRFEDATKEPEDAPLFGAKDQPVPDEPVEPKITLEESLFESGDTIHVADIDWDTDNEDPIELGLPSELDVPITDILFSNETSIDELEPEELDDRIAEWLSYSYDWAVRGFNYDDPYEEIEEGINPKDLETIKKAFGEYKSDAAIDGIFSMNSDDPNASRFAKDLADKIDDSMEESLQEGANMGDIKALFDGYISAEDIDMIFNESLNEECEDKPNSISESAESWTDVYENVFNRIVDDHFPDEEGIEAEIESAYRPHEGDPAWDEAYRRWIETYDDECEDGECESDDVIESMNQVDNWSNIYNKLSEKYNVHPVHEFDLRVFADNTDDFAKAKTIAESFNVKYKIEKSEKAIDDGKLQMTLIIPEEMIG